MLEHQKLVLQNVAYNKEIFRKEIFKSLAWLCSKDAINLYIWLTENYGDTHSDILQDALYAI